MRAWTQIKAWSQPSILELYFNPGAATYTSFKSKVEDITSCVVINYLRMYKNIADLKMDTKRSFVMVTMQPLVWSIIAILFNQEFIIG